MLVLLSNGITSEKLHNELSKHIKGTKAAIVVTADNEYKERNYHIPRVINELKEYSLSADIFDFDTQNAEELFQYDVVEIIGGNPYYLLNSIRKYYAENVLQKIARERVLIGWRGLAPYYNVTSWHSLLNALNLLHPQPRQKKRVKQI